MAGSLGRLAMVAAPLLLASTLLLGAAVGLGYYGFTTYGDSGGALIVPTAAPGTATPEPTSAMPVLRGGVTRHPPTATPDD